MNLTQLGFDLKWRYRELRERVYVHGGLAAARALPRWLRYSVTIDSISRATTGQYSTTVVPELPAMEVLKRI